MRLNQIRKITNTNERTQKLIEWVSDYMHTHESTKASQSLINRKTGKPMSKTYLNALINRHRNNKARIKIDTLEWIVESLEKV